MFDGLCWNNYEGEDPEEYDHEYGGRQFNHRDLQRIRNFLSNNEFNVNEYHRFAHIAHVPTQRLTTILLPKNY